MHKKLFCVEIQYNIPNGQSRVIVTQNIKYTCILKRWDLGSFGIGSDV